MSQYSFLDRAFAWFRTAVVCLPRASDLAASSSVPNASHREF